MPSKNFLLLYDLTVRDKHLIESIASRLSDLGYSVEVAKLKDEKQICSQYDFDVVVINKPHFFYPFRLRQKLRGVKYAVMDTEGVLPGQNYQHCLIEPDLYLHWFSHQAERYNFKKTKQAIIGYPRSYQLQPAKCQGKKLITVATNFSALGYSEKEIASRERDRRLKLLNDLSLRDYRSFQESCYHSFLKLIQENPDYKFAIKAHPNDPQSLWEAFSRLELPNVEIFDHTKDINALLGLGPDFHFCVDGCTTILDAYLSQVRVVSVNRFAPLSHSVLRSLEYANISDENLKIPEILESERGANETERVFLNELKLPSLDLITAAIVAVRDKPMVLKMHDVPTIMHFRYWARMCVEWLLVKFRKPTSRKKMGAEGRGKYPE